MLKPAVLAIACAVLLGSAQAQTIYRCGNSYSESPCPGATMVEPAHRPSREDAQAARDKAVRDMNLAERMERDRLAEEKRQGGPVKMVIGLPASAARAPAEDTRHKRGGKDGGKSSGTKAKAKADGKGGDPAGFTPAKLPADFKASAPPKAPAQPLSAAGTSPKASPGFR